MEKCNVRESQPPSPSQLQQRLLDLNFGLLLQFSPTSSLHSQMTRHFLTNKQKLAIRKENFRRKRAFQTVRLDAIALAIQQFKLPFTPSKPALSRLQNLANVANLPENDCKRRRRGAQPAIEEQLTQWINDDYYAQICVTGEMICEKGKRLRSEVNALLPGASQIEMKFTRGWLWRFQQRWN